MTDEELIRLADAYTVMMLDDPRPLPCGHGAVESGIREVLRYVRATNQVGAGLRDTAPGDGGGTAVSTTAA